MVYTGQTLSEMKELSAFIDNDKVTYIRILPNCLLEQEKLLDEHKKISDLLSELNDNRFFQQFKLHGTPCASVCHQAYFRPYLSEVDGGTVFPCDSLVLNDEIMHFNKKYSICSWNKVLDFLYGKIKMKFNAEKDCEGCVFTNNIKLLEEWVKPGKTSLKIIRKEYHMKNLYNENYFERGIETNLSCYSNYRWIPELTISMAARLIEYLCITEKDTVLDYGCAKGYLVNAFRLLHREAYGYDISDYAVANAHPDVIKYVSNTLSNFYDWIISKDVFEHIPYEDILNVMIDLSYRCRNMFVIVPLGMINDKG
jgi:2-polyprenyl-3-methyl-5-hydroxy-6-metoxy-1,4-benzoquinol methylase